MHKKSADHLLFGTGGPVRLRVSGQERVILDKQVRTEQILKLLVPIAGETGGVLQDQGENEFYYDAPSGRVHVRTMMHGERMTAIISPDAGVDLGLGGNDNLIQHNAHPGVDDNEPMDIMGNAVDPAPPVLQGQPAPIPVQAVQPVQPAPVAQPVQAAPAQMPQQRAPGQPAQIDAILRVLVSSGSSDLHLTAAHTPRMRKDGDIGGVPGFTQELSSDTVNAWMHEVAHDKARSQFAETNDADFAYEIEGVARFRMNWFRDRNGVGAVMRTIPSKVLTADQLGLPPVIRNFCELPKGLVVVTGPTGSGKSTTLAAMIDLINKSRTDHIITVEDPVEFVHQSLKCLMNQREVHLHTKSFSSALRAALREDPDIVLVGEMRDLETVHIAIETAETGHLVFGTLHTNTAMSTVDRIIDQFPTDQQSQIRVMLSESLKGVVAQTLCKKQGGGRVAALEILVVNNAVSNLIREGKTFQIASIMQTGKGIGMRTMQDALMALVQSNTITPQEAYNRAIDQALMKAALERAGKKLDA